MSQNYGDHKTENIKCASKLVDHKIYMRKRASWYYILLNNMRHLATLPKIGRPIVELFGITTRIYIWITKWLFNWIYHFLLNTKMILTDPIEQSWILNIVFVRVKIRIWCQITPLIICLLFTAIVTEYSNWYVKYCVHLHQS